jgi:hypothetical protein
VTQLFSAKIHYCDRTLHHLYLEESFVY